MPIILYAFVHLIVDVAPLEYFLVWYDIIFSVEARADLDCCPHVCGT